MKKIKEYFNQRIGCNADICKFHDKKENRCTLGEILVDKDNTKENTFCDSFEIKEIK